MVYIYQGISSGMEKVVSSERENHGPFIGNRTYKWESPV